MKPRPTSLYRHYDKKGDLLYVGISCCAVKRTSEHSLSANWFKDIKDIKIQHFPNRKLAIRNEKLAIKCENPKYNIKGIFKKYSRKLPKGMIRKTIYLDKTLADKIEKYALSQDALRSFNIAVIRELEKLVVDLGL